MSSPAIEAVLVHILRGHRRAKHARARARTPGPLSLLLCVSSPAIEAVFLFFLKAYIFVCSAVLLLYVCVLMLLCPARGGVGGGVFIIRGKARAKENIYRCVGGGSREPRVLKALLRLLRLKVFLRLC